MFDRARHAAASQYAAQEAQAELDDRWRQAQARQAKAPLAPWGRPPSYWPSMVEPVIVELAVNGATPRHRNRHVPRTPAEITEAALAGLELDASIVHNHNDEPMFSADGVHAVEPYLAAWRPVLQRHPDALLYPTMAAGARGIPVARRWAHVEELARRGWAAWPWSTPGQWTLGW
jgi:3-keto-5-aminohexanoate cleavage enzyme